MKKTLAIAVVAAALLPACGGYPKTAAEFREGASKSSLASKDSFEVRRPLDQVARTWQRKAAECLNQRVAITTRSNAGTRTTYNQHKGTVVVTKDHAELSFQSVDEAATHLKFPPGGLYFLVADAYPVSRDTTRVEIVRARVDIVADAIKAWSAGKDQGCPDPTRIFPI